jgi:hypothetical protein
MKRLKVKTIRKIRRSAMKSLNKSLFLVATIIFLITCSAVAVADDILLGRPTDDSITVNVVPDLSGDVYFEYGTESGVYDTNTSAIACTTGEPCEVVVEGLSANTQYFYRMQFRETGQSTWVPTAEYSFHTQRSPGGTFTFTITSDSHVNILMGIASVWTQTLNNVAADQPDFHLDLGDTVAMRSVSAGDVAGAEAAYEYQRPFFDIISRSAPVFLVEGNHEQMEGWHLLSPLEDSLPVIGTNAMKKYFVNPVPDDFYSGDANTYSYLDGDNLREDYYSWTWGDALFVVIDPFWYSTAKPYVLDPGGGETDTTGSGDCWDWTLGQEQYNWLKTTLETSNARYKFVFSHQMTADASLIGQEDYGHGGANHSHFTEWGGYNEDGTTWGWDTERPGWGDDPIHQMMVANGVSAFFHGHDHQYAYEMRDGIVYQSIPASGWGDGQNGFNMYTTGSGYTIQALPNAGHIRVTVSPSQTTVDYIATTGGAVNYSYTILANLSLVISGHILDPNAVPIEDVSVDASNDGGSDITDVNGYYEISTPNDWSGTVTPQKTDYTFDPNSRSYANVTADQTNQDYSGYYIPDLTPPTPDPMSWAVVPHATGTTSISMTATTATDDDTPPVEYYFECTNYGDANSSWQTNTTHVATGLNPSTEYTFRVKARDSAPSLNETSWSTSESATTDALPPELPWSDGFESGDFTTGGWTISGNATVSADAGYTGTYGAYIRGTAWIEKAIKTTGFNTIHVMYVRMTDKLDAGEYLYVEWYDGVTWHELEATQDTSWVSKDFTCASGADNNPDFKVRFRTNADNASEYAYVDDVEITGQGAAPPPIISGTILDPCAVPVYDVVVLANNGGGSDTTDLNGYYEVTVPNDWSGTVTPTKVSYTFTPPNRVYANVTEDQTNQDYTATLLTYVISGYVLDSNDSSPIDGVLMSGLPGDPCTDGSGYYSAVVDYGWSGNVTPTKYAYAFEPNSRSYANITADQTGQDYAGTLLTYNISGYILDLNDVPIDGVLVSANNGGGLDTTDPNGYYEVWVPYNWSGTVTPTDEEYTFEPPNRPYSNVLADQTYQDYVGTDICDLYPDGLFDLRDVDVICENWLTVGPEGDINGSGHVDLGDFALLSDKF